MIDEVPQQRDEVEAGPPTVDMGSLAEGLRSHVSAAAVVLWWSIFVLLIVTCFYPHTITVTMTSVYVTILVISRSVRRRAFHRNLAGSSRFSRAAVVDSREEWPKVTVLVPARDEEDDVDFAARSLAALRYPNLEIWFVNDHSTDQTPRILDEIARDFPHVHVMHDPPITEGWFGKSNALWQTFLQIDWETNPSDPNRDQSWLLFADADVVFESGILRQAVSVAERENLDFLTCMPYLVAKTWAEQLLLPTGWRGIVQGADANRLNDPDSFPIGIGAFMLVRYHSYSAFGGHKALGQWHPEDTLMAAAVKKIGGRVGFAWTSDLLRVRFYHGYRDVKKHTLRKMRIFFGENIHLPLSMMAMRLSSTLMALPMIAVGVVPQMITGRFDLLLSMIAIAGVALYIDEAREYAGVQPIAEFHPLVPWLHPLSGVLRVWFAMSLLGQIITRKPMEWRGRTEFGTSD